jgi:hypothetical protein
MLSISRVLPSLAATRMRSLPFLVEVTGASVSPRVADFKIIQGKTGAPDDLGAAGKRPGQIVAGAQARRGLLHGAEQFRRHAPLFRREVDVAGRHREPVTLAHGL